VLLKKCIEQEAVKQSWPRIGDVLIAARGTTIPLAVINLKRKISNY